MATIPRGKGRKSISNYNLSEKAGIDHTITEEAENSRDCAERMHAMVAKTAPIKVTAETNLTSLLDEAANGPLLLERDGELFRLAREDDIAYEPDPERVRRILDETAGSWADLDVDKIIADIYEARRAGSRPPRPSLM